MKLNKVLFDYSIFSRSSDRDLFQFCMLFDNFHTQWNESNLSSIMNRYNGESIVKLSFSHFIKTIDYLNHWIYIKEICSLILRFKRYFHVYRKECLNGFVIYDNFRKIDLSINGRIDNIIGLVEKNL